MMNDMQKSNDMENFLYNIAWLRKNKGISKKDMAKILKISISTLNKIEEGICPPKLSANVILRIYLKFCIRPDEQFSKRLGK